MKNLLLFLVIFGLFSFRVRANNADLFQVNEKTLTEKFQGLNKLENFVSQHEDASLPQMMNEQNPLISNIDASANFSSTFMVMSGGDFNWGQFMLGVGTGVALCSLTCLIVYLVALNSLQNAIGTAY